MANTVRCWTVGVCLVLQGCTSAQPAQTTTQTTTATQSNEQNYCRDVAELARHMRNRFELIRTNRSVVRERGQQRSIEYEPQVRLADAYASRIVNPMNTNEWSARFAVHSTQSRLEAKQWAAKQAQRLQRCLGPQWKPRNHHNGTALVQSGTRGVLTHQDHVIVTSASAGGRYQVTVHFNSRVPPRTVRTKPIRKPAPTTKPYWPKPKQPARPIVSRPKHPVRPRPTALFAPPPPAGYCNAIRRHQRALSNNFLQLRGTATKLILKSGGTQPAFRSKATLPGAVKSGWVKQATFSSGQSAWHTTYPVFRGTNQQAARRVRDNHVAWVRKCVGNSWRKTTTSKSIAYRPPGSSGASINIYLGEHGPPRYRVRVTFWNTPSRKPTPTRWRNRRPDKTPAANPGLCTAVNRLIGHMPTRFQSLRGRVIARPTKRNPKPTYAPTLGLPGALSSQLNYNALFRRGWQLRFIMTRTNEANATRALNRLVSKFDRCLPLTWRRSRDRSSTSFTNTTVRGFVRPYIRVERRAMARGAEIVVIFRQPD